MAMFSGFGSESVAAQTSSARKGGRAVVQSHFSDRAVETMLKYIYHGTATLMEAMPYASNETIELACELLQLSDFFKLEHLKEWVEKCMADWDIIRADNVIGLATHAHASNAQQLLDLLIHCLRHMIDELRGTREWEQLPGSVVKLVELPAAEAKRQKSRSTRQTAEAKAASSGTAATDQ